MSVSRSISTLTAFSNQARKKKRAIQPWMARPRTCTFRVLALAQIRAKSLFAGMGRVKAAVPLEGAQMLSAQAARIAAILGRRVGIIILCVSRARAVGLMGNDGAQDADPKPHTQAAAEAVVVAEFDLVHGAACCGLLCQSRAAGGRGGACG